jgi:hypothetical protein
VPKTEWHLAQLWVPVQQRGGAVSLGLKTTLSHARYNLPRQLALILLLCIASALAQKAQPDAQYDRQTETKTKGVVDEVKPVTFGTRKDFTELIVKSGDDKILVYLCPKPFQDEMGITFAKGDEVDVTGSKVKQEASDVILARVLVKGTDTLMFRDDKGKPVWDPRTGK